MNRRGERSEIDNEEETKGEVEIEQRIRQRRRGKKEYRWPQGETGVGEEGIKFRLRMTGY